MQIFSRCEGNRIQEKIQPPPLSFYRLEHTLQLAGDAHVAWHDDGCADILGNGPNMGLGLFVEVGYRQFCPGCRNALVQPAAML